MTSLEPIDLLDSDSEDEDDEHATTSTIALQVSAEEHNHNDDVDCKEEVTNNNSAALKETIEIVSDSSSNDNNYEVKHANSLTEPIEILDSDSDDDHESAAMTQQQNAPFLKRTAQPAAITEQASKKLKTETGSSSRGASQTTTLPSSGTSLVLLEGKPPAREQSKVRRVTPTAAAASATPPSSKGIHGMFGEEKASAKPSPVASGGANFVKLAASDKPSSGANGAKAKSPTASSGKVSVISSKWNQVWQGGSAKKESSGKTGAHGKAKAFAKPKSSGKQHGLLGMWRKAAVKPESVASSNSASAVRASLNQTKETTASLVSGKPAARQEGSRQMTLPASARPASLVTASYKPAARQEDSSQAKATPVTTSEKAPVDSSRDIEGIPKAASLAAAEPQQAAAAIPAEHDVRRENAGIPSGAALGENAGITNAAVLPPAEPQEEVLALEQSTDFDASGPWPRKEGELYTYPEFVEHFKRAEEAMQITLDAMEQTKAYRNASRKICKEDGAVNQEKAIYGRVTFEFGEFLFNNVFTTMDKTDVLLDIGSGAATLLQHAAMTRGSSCRGIEMIGDRKKYGDLLTDTLLKRGRANGDIMVRHGLLQDPIHQEFLTESPGRVFINNFSRVFKERANINTDFTLDMCVGGLFCSMLPFAELVTLCALEELPPSIDEVNAARKKRGLSESDSASFYKMEEFKVEAGHDYLSFTQNGFSLYKYTKLDSQATFLCSNPSCPAAQRGELIDAKRTVTRQIRSPSLHNPKEMITTDVAFLLSVSSCPHCETNHRTSRRHAGPVSYKE